MTSKLSGCLFCEREKWVVWRGDSLFIQLDDAPLMEGHLLICPTMHFESMGDVPKGDLEEFDRVCDRLREFYLEQYGAFTLYEHGRTGHCVIRTSADRVCHHAHVHVLPLAGDLTTKVGIAQRERIDGWSPVPDLSIDVDGYLIVESEASGRVFFPVTRPLPPHFLRTISAKELGEPELADWEVLLGAKRSHNLIQVAYERLQPKLHDLLGNTASLGRRVGGFNG